MSTENESQPDTTKKNIAPGQDVLVNGRKATVKMVGTEKATVSYRYGHREKVRLPEIQPEFSQDEVESDKIDLTFERFTGKRSAIKEDPIAALNKKCIQFNSSAIEVANLDEYSYINYYISDNPNIFAVKPTRYGGVDGNSYSLTDGQVSWANLRKTLGIEIDSGHEKVEPHWKDDESMFILDVSDLRDDS
jgi:hypothetical protein